MASKNINELLIFVVDDDKLYNKFISHHLSFNPDNVVENYFNGKDLLKSIFKNPSVVILDYNLPEINGDEILQKIKAYNPDINVIIVSGQEDISTAINLLKSGASDYLDKNDETKERLWASIKNIRDKILLKNEIQELKQELETHYNFSESMIGSSNAMKNVFATLEKACKSNINTSIYGETGTGKENVGRALHELSPRAVRKFVPINAASSSDELFESTLFGHVRGSFTGAQTDRPGLVEDAKGGTLFIDEVADLSPLAQIRLLRFIQQGTYRRVGENHERRADARIVVAANQPLEDLVAAGRFREDLFSASAGWPSPCLPCGRGAGTSCASRATS